MTLRCILALTTALILRAGEAQPLPSIELRPTFPSLALHLPVGMEEAPDGSGRFYILEQDGRILMVTNGADGSAARELLNLANRHPHTGVENGLLGLAFHPRFRTNGLFYIYYTQQNLWRRVIILSDIIDCGL
jgi:glucose/arabinose dehydrogenase